MKKLLDYCRKQLKLSRRDFLKISAFSAASGLFWNCGGIGESNESSSDDTMPSDDSSDVSRIIMFVVDTLRADHLPISGYGRDTAPYMTEFSKNAFIFENAISPCSWTVPSYVSMMTGMFGYNHNQHREPDGTGPRLDKKQLIEYLNEHGYNTIFIFTNPIIISYETVYNEIYNCDHGFDQNENDMIAINTAKEWLSNSENLNKNFFMLIWLMSPHWRYQTDNDFFKEFVSDEIYALGQPIEAGIDCSQWGAIKYEELSTELQQIIGPSLDDCYQESNLYTAAYDANIKYADYQMGQLLNYLKEKGLYDDTMIIFTSDHGENMVDHEVYFEHGCNLYQSLIHVPLLIKFRKQEQSFWINSPVRTIDIMPTIFDVLKIDTGDIDGKSLLPVIEENVDLIDRPCISYRQGMEISEDGTWEEDVSIINGNYKLIKTLSENELYDIIYDVEEKENIASLYPDIVDDLNEYLGRFYEPRT